MEGGEVMPNGKISNGYASDVSCGNGFEQVCNGNGLEQVYREHGSGGAGVSENVNGDITELVLEGLEGMEECWEDVSDRLMISQMVSDSVIKGMVTAVELDCAERIAAKELEVASLKENMAQKEYNVGESSSLTGVCEKREKMRGELNALRNLAIEQFKKVYEEIECATGSNLLKKARSGSELVGLGGILQEKHSESWVYVNEMLHCLKTRVDTVCKKVDDILLCPDISFCGSRQDIELAKVENVAPQTICRSPREEFEKNLLEHNFQLCGIQNMNWLEKFNDIATLGTKLDAIQKSLSMPEAELISYGSHDLDNLHLKAFGNHVTPPTSLCGENGTGDASNAHVAESYDFQQLKHMTKEELVGYFNSIIIKIKRDHESDQHLMTDKYFCLKREYLKLKGSFFTRVKDEEFDELRKKFSEVIPKLEDFLSENKRFPALTTNLESMQNMMHRLENLLSENRLLRDRLNDKENEVKCLKEQVLSSASEILQRSLAEQNLLKLVESLRSAVEDSCIEASLSEEIYNSAMREQIAQTWCSSEAAYPAETASKYGIDDSDIESLIMQGLNALVFIEIIGDAGRQLDDLHQKVLLDEEAKAFLERKSLEKDNELSLEIEEQELLKKEILELRIAMENEQKLGMDLSISLSKEREQFELASQELITSKEHASRLQALVTESNKDFELLRSQHLEALEQIDVYEMELNKLNQELAQTEPVLTEANRERSKAVTLVQEMEAREQTMKKEMELAAGRFSKLFADFEWRVSGALDTSSSRLEDTSSHLKALTGMANVLTRAEQIFKQKLERRNIDLKMAESEVDLLGDEVDALLRLLEKIYIALDHYSPVLKHYPGIIEILELVRRELSGESTIRL